MEESTLTESSALMRLSVRARLLGGFAILLALMGLLVVVALNSISGLQTAQREMSGKALPYLEGLSDAALAAKSAATDERGFLLTHDQKFATEAVGRREAEQAGLSKARAAAVNSAEVAAVDAVEAGLAAFNRALDAEFALAATDPAAAQKASLGPNRELRKTYEDSFKTAIGLAKEQVAAATAESDHLAARSRTVLGGTVVLMVVVGMAIAWLLARSISRPLATAVTVLEAAAGGDLTRRAQVTGPIEFQRMAQATNQMLSATAETVRTLATNAANLVETARQMAAASDAIASSAEVTSSKAGAVSSNAAEVSDGVRTVSVAAEEMGSTISEIASSVSRAAGVSAEAVTSADAARDAVGQLDASSRQIDTVVKLITSIAEQTNLLALNATIEAARAGDAGKGFAVVAGEVKDLAQETAKATGEITTQVNAIQNDTRRAVEAIGRISQVIGAIDQHQGAIATAVEEQTATTNEMSRSINEIAASTESITSRISDVAGTVTASTASIQQTRQSASTLSDMAGELHRLVDRFRY